MATFAYVYYWHGAYDYLLYWAVSQWLGVFIEAMAAKLLKTKTLQHLEVSVELNVLPLWIALSVANCSSYRSSKRKPKLSLFILKGHTDRTRFGNATRIFSFQKQIKPSTDKNLDQIAKIAERFRIFEKHRKKLKLNVIGN
jgi:hypothetical protein